MAKTKTQLRNELKTQYMEKVTEFFEKTLECEVLQYKDFEFSVPVVDSEGNEEYIQIKVCLPTGSRDGEPFDGYAMAEDYQLHQRQKREKAEAAAAAKAKKMERDAKMRARKAEQKSQRA